MIYPMVGTALLARVGADAEIIAAKKYSMGEDERSYIILCSLKDNTTTPYVTWIYDSERVACFHGDYCYVFEQAIKSFNERGTF